MPSYDGGTRSQRPAARSRFRGDSRQAPSPVQGPQRRRMDFVVGTEFRSSKPRVRHPQAPPNHTHFLSSVSAVQHPLHGAHLWDERAHPYQQFCDPRLFVCLSVCLFFLLLLTGGLHTAFSLRWACVLTGPQGSPQRAGTASGVLLPPASSLACVLGAVPGGWGQRGSEVQRDTPEKTLATVSQGINPSGPGAAPGQGREPLI